MAGQYQDIGSSSPPPIRRQMTGMGAAMERGTWDPDMEMIPPIVNGLMFYNKLPKREAFIRAFEGHVWPNHRFHSCMEDGTWVARDAQMDTTYHFIEVTVAGDADIDAYVQKTMAEPLSAEYPPWRMHLLRGREPGRSAILFRLHHSISDGMGLLFGFSPIIGCEAGDPLMTIPLPKVMLPPAQQRMAAEKEREKQAQAPKDSGGGGCGLSCCSSMCAFCRGCAMVVTAKHDSELAINAPLADRTPFVHFNGNRVYTRFPPIPMTEIKAICKKHSCTVNDVLMSALTGALRRYGGEVAKDQRLLGNDKLDFSSMVMIALPRPIDEDDMMTALRNAALFASCPLPIDEAEPLGRLKRTIAAFNNLKSPPYMAGLRCLTDILQGVLPQALLKKAVSETFSKHSLLVTNVPGMTVPITFPKQDGQEVGEIHMVFPNVIPQVSMISYNGFVFANMVADPGLFAKPLELGRLWAAEFGHLAAAEPEIE